MRLNYAIDFDKTFTADPLATADIIRLLQSRGHQVFIVTIRRDTDENVSTIDSALALADLNVPVFFTGLKAKKPFVENIGVAIDIWMDDDPRTIVEDY